MLLFFFFFNDTATTEIYTLSLHDALPISREVVNRHNCGAVNSLPDARWLHFNDVRGMFASHSECVDRKSTRLNSSHANISYAVFCLKKKKKNNQKVTISCPFAHYTTQRPE